MAKVLNYDCEKIRLMLQSEENIMKIIRAISDGDRIEIVPTKEGAKLLRVHKDELNKHTSS